jgi:acetyl esterase/lipase
MTITRRKLLQMTSGAGMSALFGPVAIGQKQAAPAARAKATEYLYDYVNPEFRAVLEKAMKSLPPWPDLSDTTLPFYRQSSAGMAKPRLQIPAVQELMIPGPANSPQVKVFVIGATPGAHKPLVFHTHGGGFVSGAAANEVGTLQQLALKHDCVVITVDYRLAPETKLPGSLEDNYAALRWVHQNAKDLGVDTTRIALKGESAGGGHAAMLAIAVRDRREFKLCQQILIYPMLDDRTGSSRQMPPYIGQFFWDVRKNRYGWTALLGVPAGSSSVLANSVPARVADLSGLPPTFIGVGSIDLFGPEDIDFSSRLVAAGVSTEMVLVPGAFHGFDIFIPDAPLSVRFSASWNGALKRAFVL